VKAASAAHPHMNGRVVELPPWLARLSCVLDLGIELRVVHAASLLHKLVLGLT